MLMSHPSTILQRSRRLRRVALAAGFGLGAVLATAAPGARAALPVGASAPDFSAEAAVGGQAFQFSLSKALAQGPVVLYFYPKAFTSGCTIEAKEFADASDRFKALGATVVGMSNDDIATLKKFSVEACRSKFAVAADAGAKVMKAYDAALAFMPNTADRISYVISPAGKVIYAYSNLSANGHVENTLQVVERWRAAAKR
jgi:peroxiredoxin